MTITHAERITGLDIREIVGFREVAEANPIRADGTERAYAAYEGDRLVAQASGVGWPARFAEDEALSALVEAVYHLRCALVAEQQAFRCFACYGLCPMETDHIIARSHGRDDRRVNLRALCVPCHARRHAEPKWVLGPHPRIVDLMAQVGLVWREGARGWQALTTSTPSENDSPSTSSKRS